MARLIEESDFGFIAVGQAARDIAHARETVTTQRQCEIKGARRVGKAIVLQPDRL
jgi:hypothetical protein